mmetsp:Transcript_19874/g.39972  ORF Transcript_19874/g.39972 Transcript_19874/m.39972 type:complete len:215 (-) Transcript_19874:637-1281(-)
MLAVGCVRVVDRAHGLVWVPLVSSHRREREGLTAVVVLAVLSALLQRLPVPVTTGLQPTPVNVRLKISYLGRAVWTLELHDAKLLSIPPSGCCIQVAVEGAHRLIRVAGVCPLRSEGEGVAPDRVLAFLHAFFDVPHTESVITVQTTTRNVIERSSIDRSLRTFWWQLPAVHGGPPQDLARPRCPADLTRVVHHVVLADEGRLLRNVVAAEEAT